MLKFLCTVGKKELAGWQLPSCMENAQERNIALSILVNCNGRPLGKDANGMYHHKGPHLWTVF